MINLVYYLISDSNLPIIPMLYDDIIAKLTSLKFKKDLIFFKVQSDFIALEISLAKIEA
jgi:hypothetical protein